MPDAAAHCVVSRDDVRRLDAFTIEAGTCGSELMERAGLGIAACVETFYEREILRIGRRAPGLLVLAGSGNNGGDGFVVARLLTDRGWSVTVAAIGSAPAKGGDAENNRTRWLQSGGTLLETDDEIAAAIDDAGANPEQCHDIVLDTMLGTGLDREVGQPYRSVIEQINRSGTPTIAVDIPSGLGADSGKPLGVAIKATLTVTIGAGKPGLFLAKGPDYCGPIEIVDIGLADPEIAKIRPLGRMISAASVRHLAWTRHRSAHKGESGHVLVIGGSLGKTGAVLLAARGALRSGAGLVTFAVPASLAKTTDAALWEAMAIELPDDGHGHCGAGAWAGIAPSIANYSAVVLGPGLATGEGARELVFEAIREVPCVLVLDADGLNALAADPEASRDAIMARDDAGHGDLVLTPHPGEMARLIASSSAAVQGDRMAALNSFLSHTGQATLILKGAATLVARDERRGFNTSGNPGMAAAGMGDVLSGVVGACAGIVGDSFDAACLAVYAHGAAGDALAREIDGPGFFASEVADAVPEVLAALRRDAQTGLRSSLP